MDRNGHVGRVVIAMCGAGLLAACENPLPPGSCGTIPEQTVVVGEQATVSACFEDPNGDPLSYRATTSDAGVATVSVSGSALTVAGVSPGTSVVTVTATDVTELTGDQQFRVLVPNRAPVAVGEIGSREMPVGESASVDVSAHFREPDGQPLSYGMSVSDEGVVTISAAGPVVTLVAEAKGSATVTATATDPGGLSATQSFVVTVPNRAPVATGSIPPRTIEVDAAATADVTPFFTDPDGDDLAYAATSSAAAVAEVSVEGGELTVAAVAKGEATVTVTATDTEGLTAMQQFPVTVPNRPPVAVGTIEGRTIEVDEVGTLALSGYFSDPDGDDLVYGAVISDEAVAVAEVGGGALTVTAVAKGAAVVNVTATDTEGLTATQAFAVTVPNRAPVTAAAIEGLIIEVGEAAAMELAEYFGDPDGDGLAYSAAASEAGVAGVAVEGGTLTVTAVAKGEATVTVIATDPEGLAATQEFVVTVPNRSPRAVGSIGERALEVGESAKLELPRHFEDPDGDELAYSASSSDAALIAVSVEGGAVTVEALARGRAVVAVTATDNEGLTASQEFAVAVANRPPLVVAPIEGQTLEVGESVAVELSGHFEDPDGDALVYTAAISDESVVDVSVSGGAVTVTALRKGEATVAVTATDTTGADGLSATQEFAVTVPNRPPQPVGTVAAMKVTRGGTRRVDPSPHFADPDGEALDFQATSSDARIAKAWMSANGVVVRGVRKGTATVTITAEDAEGLTAMQQFAVEVTGSNGSGSNRPPFTTGAIGAQTLTVGRSRTLDASGFFSDPDGDKLEFSAQSSGTGVVTVAVSLSRVELEAVAVGTATVTITARDPDGLSAALGFTVTVTEVTVLNRPPYTVGSFSPQTLDVAETKRFSAASHFRDPDGDDLRFSAQSSDNGVVTATVSGSEVALAAAAEGSATVVLTAADPDGLTATADFDVTVTEGGGDNRPPVVLDEVAAQDLEVGEAVTVTATSLFADPDFDELTFSAQSSDTEVVEAKVSGSAFEFDAVDEGNAMVTVTAEDPEGLSASQEFGVAVVKEIPNRPPVVTDTVPDLEVEIGRAGTLPMLGNFSDPDDDDLSLSVLSSNTAVVEVEIYFGGFVKLRAVGTGSATVSVTATDPGGLSANLEFDVAVAEEIPNRAPVVINDVRDLRIEKGSDATVYLLSYFRDPDGDDLSASAVSSDTTIVKTEVGSGTTVRLTGEAVGNANVTVTVRDPEDATAAQSFGVRVSNANRGPVAVGTMPDLALNAGESVDVDVEPYFEDPEGDELIYILRARDDYSYEVARPTDYGTVGIVVTAFACGTAALEARATDGRGRTAHQYFDVVASKTGPNQDPEPVPEKPLYTTGVLVGDTRTVRLTDRSFRDPDPEDVLYYEATPAAVNIVGVRGPPSAVTLVGQAPGNTTVAITAKDGCGGSSGPHSLPVIVRSQNTGPSVNDGITWESFTIEVGDTVSFDLNSLFSDPEGDPLTFEGLTSPSTKLDHVVSNGVMKVWGVGAGSASMSASAFDPFGELAELPWISVLVSDPDEDSEQLAQGRGPGGGGSDHVAASGQQPIHVREPRHRP